MNFHDEITVGLLPMPVYTTPSGGIFPLDSQISATGVSRQLDVLRSDPCESAHTSCGFCQASRQGSSNTFRIRLTMEDDAGARLRDEFEQQYRSRKRDHPHRPLYAQWIK